MEDTETRRERILDPDFLLRLERLAIAAKKVQLGLAKGERKSKRKGISTEFADYRDYVQGDDLRFVDWNIFARLNSLYLKIFQEFEDLTVHLLIDASQSMDFGSPKKIEFAIKLSAAIGYVALVSLDRVAPIALSGGELYSARPIRGKASAGRLFQHLETIAASGDTQLEAACKKHLIQHRGKGVAILISDFFDPGGYEGAMKRLMQTGCDLYAIHVMAPEEIDPDLSGDLKLIDSETGAASEISVSRSLMKRYHRNRQEYCDAIRSHCLARDIAYFFVSSDTPVERLTLDVLRKGGLLV